MKKNIQTFLTTVLLFLSPFINGQTSVADGDWADDATWGGTSPGFIDLDAPIIESYVIANSGLSFVNENGKSLTIRDTLIVYGDVLFNVDRNNAEVTIESNNVLIIFGDLNLGKNNAGVQIDAGGVLVVDGDITADNTANSSITGDGNYYTSGTTSGITDNTSTTEGVIDELSDDGYESIEEFVLGGGTGVLPVELLYFTGSAPNQTNELFWATSSELNNDYFIVERSEDGGNFYEIGKVEGNGNSNEIIEYTFTDQSPVASVSYYRLRQVDYDRQFEVFNVIRVESKFYQDIKSIVAYPSLISDAFFIKSAKPITIEQLTFSDLNGQVRANLRNDLTQKNQLLYEANVSNLENGIYIVKIITSEGVVHSSKLKVLN